MPELLVRLAGLCLALEHLCDKLDAYLGKDRP